MAITVDPNTNIYDMAEMRIDQETIIANEFNLDIGEDGGDGKPVTNSSDPVRYGASKNTYEWGCSGIEPEFYDFLVECKMKKKLFSIKVFNFGADSKYNHMLTANNARIKEVNMSFGDDGYTIDISGSALSVDI